MIPFSFMQLAEQKKKNTLYHNSRNTLGKTDIFALLEEAEHDTGDSNTTNERILVSCSALSGPAQGITLYARSVPLSKMKQNHFGICKSIVKDDPETLKVYSIILYYRNTHNIYI